MEAQEEETNDTGRNRPISRAELRRRGLATPASQEGDDKRADWRNFVSDRLNMIEADIRLMVKAFWGGFIFIILAFGGTYMVIDSKLDAIAKDVAILVDRDERK